MLTQSSQRPQRIAVFNGHLSSDGEVLVLTRAEDESVSGAGGSGGDLGDGEDGGGGCFIGTLD